MTRQTIGLQLRALRIARGLSIAETSRRSGISRAQVVRLEHGEGSMGAVIAVAGALGASVTIRDNSESARLPDTR